MRISDWSSDVCSSDLVERLAVRVGLECRLEGPRADGIGVLLAVSSSPAELDDLLVLRVRCGDGQATRQGHAEGLEPSFHVRSEEHTSELQSLMRISYAVFCLKKKKPEETINHAHN